MELPQRSFGTEGRKPTHDFLSLYTQSAMQQDPRPPSSQAGGYLKTHDFLQPLERVWKTMGKEESNGEISSAEEKPAPPTPPTQPQPPPSSVEHILPGGIGTYSISHISYCNNQRYPKAEGGAAVFAAAQASSTDKNDQENSNCSSYTGSGFTIWEESAAFKKGKTGKKNFAAEKSIIIRDTEVFLAATEAAAKSGQWTTTSERPSLSSSNNHRNSFSSLSSSQPPMQKSQSFLEMIKSAKGSSTQDDELEDVEEFVLKKETQSPIHTGGLRVKVDEKSIDQKANTPRSKHSATEQRRRSKINDRFQMLRELIPHGDQKRDKASFLLEVIEYIQFLQEKVNKYEGPYQGWNREPAKLVPWRNNTRHAEGFVDQSRGVNSNAGPALLFSTKLDEKNIIPPSIPGNAQNPVESDIRSAVTFKAMDHHSGVTNRTPSFPMTPQPNFFNPSSSLPPRLASNAENMATQPPSCTTDGTVAGDELREQDLTIEAGRISISSAYSQGLLTTLTQALKSSGVDLSQASVSVQIELGKRGNGRTIAPPPITKGTENSIIRHQVTTTHSRVSGGEDSDQLLKKLKTCKS